MIGKIDKFLRCLVGPEISLRAMVREKVATAEEFGCKIDESFVLEEAVETQTEGVFEAVQNHSFIFNVIHVF